MNDHLLWIANINAIYIYPALPYYIIPSVSQAIFMLCICLPVSHSVCLIDVFQNICLPADFQDQATVFMVADLFSAPALFRIGFHSFVNLKTVK